MAGRNSTVDLFMSVLRERHDDLNTAVRKLLEVLVSENIDQKKEAARKVADLTPKLQDVLSRSDIPRWLRTLSDAATSYVNGQRSTQSLLLELVSVLPEMTAHKWALDDTPDSALDFDAIFELYRSESRLPELFDKIVEILEGIKDSGDVDSLSMIEALTKVILAIKKGKSGSYLALNGAWSFLVNFLNNYLWAELANTPVFGAAFAALQKTIEETGKEMDHLHESMHEEIVRSVKAEVKLMDKPDMEYLGYSRQGKITSLKDSSMEISEA